MRGLPENEAALAEFPKRGDNPEKSLRRALCMPMEMQETFV